MSVKLGRWVQSFNRTDIVFIFVLLLAALLRLYRLPSMANYDFDQEYATEFVFQVVREYPVRYVGQGMSIQGLFMGPWYFYFLVPFYLLTGLNPLGGYFGSVLIGLTTVATYYFVGKKIFGAQVGLWAAWVRAISCVAIEADWSLTPAFSSDLVVLVTWYGLYQLWRGRRWWLVPLALIFGTYTSFHPIQFPFYFVFLGLGLLWRWRFSLRQLAFSAIAFLVPIFPLILFDYWRHWSMLRQVVSLTQVSAASSTGFGWAKAGALLRVIGQFGTNFLQLPMSLVLPTTLLLGVGGLGLIWRGYRQQQMGFHLVAATFTTIIFVGYYLVFPSNVPEYYLGAIRALLFLYGGLGFTRILRQGKWGWRLAVVVIVWITVRNLQTLERKWHYPFLTTLAKKQTVVRHVQEHAAGQPFRVNYIAQPGWGSGFSSLFAVSGNQPGESGPIYNIVTPVDLIDSGYLDFRDGNIGVLNPRD